MTDPRLLDRLKKLLQTQFDELVGLLDVDRSFLSPPTAAQATRAHELGRWAEQSDGNEARLREALARVEGGVGHGRRPPGARVPIPEGLRDAMASRRLVVWVGDRVAKRGLADALLEVFDVVTAREQDADDRVRREEVATWSRDDRWWWLAERVGADIARLELRKLMRASQGGPLVDAAAGLRSALLVGACWGCDLVTIAEHLRGQRPFCHTLDDQPPGAPPRAGEVIDLLSMRGHDAPVSDDDRRTRVARGAVEIARMEPRATALLLVGVSDEEELRLATTLRASLAAGAEVFWLAASDPRTKRYADRHQLRVLTVADEHQPRFVDELAHAARSAALRATVDAIGEALDHEYEGRHQEAEAAFKAEDYETALRMWRECLDSVEAPLTRAPEEEKLRRWRRRWLLNVATCELNLQHDERAREIVESFTDEGDVPAMSDRQRANLAVLLALLGEVSRAERVVALPDDPARSDEDRRRIEYARTRVALLRGDEPPDAPPEELSLLLATAQAWLHRGDAARAVAHGLAAVQSAAGRDVLATQAAGVVVDALAQSVWEMPGVSAPVPVPQREEVVRAVEGALSLERLLKLPSKLRDHGLLAAMQLAALTEDDAAVKRIGEKLREFEVAFEDATQGEGVVARAFDYAHEGRLDEAFAIADTLGGAPWIRSGLKADVLVTTGRFDDALRLALRLVEEYPGRAPLEFRAARLLGVMERREEALHHARAAFELLPGAGYRKLYARCLQMNQEHAEASRVVQPLLDRGDDEAERLAIFLAAQVDPAQELERLGLYLARHPRAWLFRLHRAGALYRTGDLAGAAREARDTLDEAGDELSLDMVRQSVGLAQVRSGPLDEVTIASLRRVDAMLRERFPREPLAEALRLELRFALGTAAPDAPIDMALVTATGRAQTFHIDEMAERVHAQRAFSDLCATFYRQGDLSFEAFCKLTGEEPAWLVERIAALAGDKIAALVTPVAPLSRRPTEALRGTRILLGVLEVLLLQKLDLLATFLEWTRAGRGKVVLFREVYNELLQSVPRLAMTEQHDERERRDKLKALTGEPWFNAPKGHPTSPDEAWATARGLTLVTEEAAAPWNLAGLLATLRARNRLDPELLAEIVEHLPTEPGEVWSPALPPLAFGMDLLDELHRHGGNAAVVAVHELVGELIVGPMGWARFEQHRRVSHERAAALSLAHGAVAAIGTGVREHLVEQWPGKRPHPDDLWLPLPDAPGHKIRASLRTACGVGLAYRIALHEDPSLTLVTADFVAAGALTERWRMLRETAPIDPARRGWLQDRLPLDEPRLFAFDRLLDALTPDDRRQEQREKLARMGMVTALDAASVRRLARRWRGLREGGPAEVLSQMESAAKNIEHLGVVFARQHLASVYAEAIWMSYVRQAEGDVAPDAMLRDLLRRSEELDETLPLRSLDLAFMYLAGKTLYHPFEVFESTDGSTWTLAPNTPAARLWKAAAEWCAASHERTISLGRGVRELLVHRAEQDRPLEGAHNGAVGAILLETLRVGESFEGRMLHPAVSATAILSAVWKERPLDGLFSTVRTHNGMECRLVLEEMLRSAATWLGTTHGNLGDGATLAFRHPIDDRNDFPVQLPVDAVLLRANHEVLRRGAHALAFTQTPHDGEGARLLRRLAETPDDAALRGEYALHTVAAPWRQVREDPAVLLAWWSLHRAALSGLHALEALRSMLSEPDSLAGHTSVRDLLRHRLDGAGAWGPLDAKALLLEQALLLPGSLAFEAKLLRFSQASEAGRMALVQASLDALERADDVAVGELSAHLYLLAIAARRYPYVKVRDRQDVDLHARLTSAIVGLLEALLRPPREGSLAWAEDSVLRVCGRVVEDLARPSMLPSADDIWLTWRLYQWWGAQLPFVHPEVRADALRTLVKHAPPLRGDFPVDRQTLFDPYVAGRGRCDRRLATVLFALASLEEAAGALPDDLVPRGEATPFNASSPALESRLAELAQRPLTDFEERTRTPSPLQQMFGWPVSGAVPDLALTALLRLDGTAFARLPVECRLRWIRALLPVPERPPLDGELTDRLFLSIVASLDEITPEERGEFGVFLRALDPSTELGAARRLFGFTALFEAGEIAFEADARAALEQHIARRHDMAPDLFGLYLIAAAKHAPDRWVAEARRLLSLAPDAVPLAQAVGRVATSGPREQIAAAQDLLRALAEEEPYRHDTRYHATLRALGLDEPQGE